MFNPIYLSESSTDSFSGETIVHWYNILLNSTLSTTRYLQDHYPGVQFKVIGQEEKDGRIVRTSEFVIGRKVIVHNVVEIDVARNPKCFLDLLRGQATPIGDILRDCNYRVEREILAHDALSKVYVMKGDVNLKITEKYYDM